MCEVLESSMDGKEGQNPASGWIIKDILYKDWIVFCCVIDAWRLGLYEYVWFYSFKICLIFYTTLLR